MERTAFIRFADKVRSFGFEVYLNKDELYEKYGSNYAVITDGKNIGGMQQSDFNQNAVTLSTVHKPGGNCGTAFAISKPGTVMGTEDYDFSLDELTPELIRSTFVIVPPGFSLYRVTISKYADFEEWKRKSPYRDQYQTD